MSVRRKADASRYRLEITNSWNGEPLTAAERAAVELEFDSTERLLAIEFTAPLHGDPRPVAAAGELDGLWNYEVVELFLMRSPGPAAAEHQDPNARRPLYIEIEAGPWGHYLVLAFQAPRRRSSCLQPLAHCTSRGDTMWSSRLLLSCRELPAAVPEQLHANAFAMHGESAHGERRHLACRPVPGARPDFHQLAAAAPLQSFEIDKTR